MATPPAVASPGAGTQPAPATDELPPEDVLPPVETEEDEKRRRRKFLLLLLLLAAFIVLLGLAIWYLIFRQPINVLPPIPGTANMPSYVTSIYGAERPLGVAVTADGRRVYVGETGGERNARVFEQSGTELAQMLPPLSTGQNHVPVYLAVEPTSGDVYVTDRQTGSIYIYNAEGAYLRTFPTPTSLTGWQPLAISFDPAGNLLVTDVSTHVVLVLDPTGSVLFTIGQDEEMQFPNGVAADQAGYLYVTDSNNGRLLVFDAGGKVVAQIGRGVGEGNLGLPRGLAIGDDDRVYVADATAQGVFVYSLFQPGTARLDFLGSFGSQGISDGTFQFPAGLTLDTRGRVYVADTGNNRVQVWSY